MAGEQATNTSTGSSTAFTLGSGLVAENPVGQLITQGQMIGDVLILTSQEVVRLGIAYKAAQERAAQGGREWLGALTSIYGNLTNQIVAVGKLTTLYQNLGKAMQSAKLPADGGGLADHGASVIGASNTVLQAAGQTVMQSASYREIVADIAIKGENDPDDRGDRRKEISAKVDELSGSTGMGKAEAAGLIRELLNSGLDLKQSLDFAPIAAQFSVGQGVSAQDTAVLIRSMSVGGVKDGEIGSVLNAMISQAKTGSVGIGDVSQMMPRLIAAMAAQEKVGATNVVLAAQMLQARGAKLGSAVQVTSDVEHQITQGDLPSLERISGIDYMSSDLNSRRDESAQIYNEMGAAFSRLSINIGDALSPVTDLLMRGVTVSANLLGDLVKAGSPLVTVLGTLALTATAVVSAFGAIRAGKELLSAGKAVFTRGSSETQNGRSSWLKRVGSRLLGVEEQPGPAATGPSGANLESKVFVVNWPKNFAPDGGKEPPGKPLAKGSGREPIDVSVVSWPEPRPQKTGQSVQRGAEREGHGAPPSSTRETGTVAVNRKESQGSAVDQQGRALKPTRVVVLNWPNKGPQGRNDGPTEKRRNRRRTRVERHQDAARNRAGQLPEEGSTRNAPRDSVSSNRVSGASGNSTVHGGFSSPFSSSFAGGGGPSLSLGSTAGAWSRAAGMVTKLTSFTRFIPGARYLDAGMTALDTFQRAGTVEEKAEGYGAAAGNLGGSVVGGVVGAAIGSVLIPIPGVGAAIGGMLGSSLGGMAGEDLGGQLGRFLFGSSDKPPERLSSVSSSPAAAAPVATTPVVGNSLNQQIVSVAGMLPGEYVQPVPAPLTASAASNVFMPPSRDVQPAVAVPPAPQYFTISPSIPITVQGNITNPDELVSQLAPAIQRMFTDLAAQANRGNQMWDSPAATYVA
ncbi:phage tail tape measure protein [Pseudomonas sp. zfem002]|uniref:phage tail tape measure protein n=1 Tax=Pseudomonas sp. zfem002 TaxID=3078197 RepID=UPI002927E81A|nr:phage tail tape measure protein [Pseudomonas sp. zfem002]MDU9391511.1 phage tail tape measure protein [Pseudomonas sp. zfem002]